MMPRHGRFWLLAALAATLLPQLLRQPLWLTLFSLALLGWRLVFELHGGSLPKRPLRLLLTLAGIAAILLTYRTLFGLDAGLALIGLMLSLKLLEMHKLRDAMFILFLGWFLVAGGFLVDQSLPTGLYLALNVLLLTTALLALHHPQGASIRHYLRHSGLLLLQSLPLMVLLFVLFPRLPGPLWGIPENSSKARTGLADHMEIGNITELADSDEVAFRVQFADSIPPAGELYWRGPVLWKTDGRRWDPVTEKTPPAWFFRPVEIQGESIPLAYTLTVEPHDQRWVFALEMPDITPPGTHLSGDGQLLTPRKLSQRKRYELSSQTQYTLPAITPGQRELALQLPAQQNPRTHALAASWSTLEPQQIIRAALHHFREEDFWYSRKPPRLGTHAMDDFLFNTRRGFCEHYAASFVTLMRAAGLPARIVTGYQGAEGNPLGDHFIVRQSHAHAWAEVWLEDAGWQRVDPTAMIPPSRIEAEDDIGRFQNTRAPMLRTDLGWMTRNLYRLRYSLDLIDNAWNQWVLGYNDIQQKKLLEKLGLHKLGWQGILLSLLAALGTILLLIMAWLLWQGRSRHDALGRLHIRYCRKLRHLGIHCMPHDTATGISERLAHRHPRLAPEAQHIARLYNRLRYRKYNTTEYELLKKLIRNFRT